MKKYLSHVIYLIPAIVILSACSPIASDKPLTQVPFNNVHLDDIFWAPKIEVNRTVSIPSAFRQSDETGRMDNFAVAGGLIEKEHQGDFPFDDTDVYKILEGASYALAVQYDEELDGYLDSMIYLIGIGQEGDGYVYTCITNKCERLRPWYGKGRWDRINSHELYNCGHLYEAAVAHYQATGKRSLLDIAIKNANLINEVFGPGENQKHVPSGHPIIEMALVKLYHATQDEKYLKLARYFIDETGIGTDGHKLNKYSQDHMPIVEQEEAVGHAVRLGYLYSGVTDVASLMHDEKLMDASKRVWDNVVSKKLYITGGIGSRAQGEGFGDNYELPNMADYCETCASIANVYWNYRLFLNEKESKYYDVLERVLYNGLISGVSLGGDKFFYDNPLESIKNHDRQPWFGCACCPGNVTRFMASIPGYVYATDDKAIYVNLFAQGSAIIPFGSGDVVMKQQTRYPWEGAIELKIEKVPEEEFDLFIRIPGWVKGEAVPSDLYHFFNETPQNYNILINGNGVSPQLINGYALLKNRWRSGDVVSIELPMSVKKVVANEKVINNHKKLAYQRGPIVYCFEDKDNEGAWLFDNYIPSETFVTTQFESGLLGGIVSMNLKGKRLIMEGEKVVNENAELKAIPYYAWNNRGTSNMLVWMAAEPDAALLKRPPSITDGAETTASSGYAFGLNEGFDPENSGDLDKSYFYWWLKEGTEEWVQYSFETAVTLKQSSVYWLNLDHYDGNYRVPENWNLQYLDQESQWQSVATKDVYGTLLDQYITINFDPVETKALRLNAKLQNGESAGILEWKLD